MCSIMDEKENNEVNEEVQKALDEQNKAFEEYTSAKAAVICFFIPSSLFLLTVLLLRYASAQATFGWFYYSKNRPIWACFQSSK